MKHVQRIGLTTVNMQNTIGKDREILIDTTKRVPVVHNGADKGGVTVAREDLLYTPVATPVSAGKMSAAQAQQLSDAIAAILQLDSDKAFRSVPARVGAVATLDAEGDVQDSNMLIASHTADHVPVFDSNGDLSASPITAAVFAFLANVTSDIQAQFNKFVGCIMPIAGSTAPAGTALCHGQAISRVDNPILFSLIGTTYGAGDGATTFNVPDMRGRTPIGRDNMGGVSANRITGAWADNLGATAVYGEEKHALTVAELAEHDHTITIKNVSGGDILVHYGLGAATGAGSAFCSTYTGSTNVTGSSTPHNNVQPSHAFNFAIVIG